MSSRTFWSTAGSTVSVRASTVRTVWCSTSARSSPKALNSPGAGGTSTVPIPSERATPQACRGPAPPKAMRMNPAGSRPRSTDTDLIARTMFEFAMRCTPYAASVSESPEGAARASSTARRARERSMRRAPPASDVGWR